MNGQPKLLDCLFVLRMDDARDVVALPAELESDCEIRAMIAASTGGADRDTQSFSFVDNDCRKLVRSCLSQLANELRHRMGAVGLKRGGETP
jgi:hypothetical protein